jgi:hypothetical protein
MNFICFYMSSTKQAAASMLGPVSGCPLGSSFWMLPTPPMSCHPLHPAAAIKCLLSLLKSCPAEYTQGAAIGDIFLSTAVINHDR